MLCVNTFWKAYVGAWDACSTQTASLDVKHDHGFENQSSLDGRREVLIGLPRNLPCELSEKLLCCVQASGSSPGISSQESSWEASNVSCCSFRKLFCHTHLWTSPHRFTTPTEERMPHCKPVGRTASHACTSLTAAVVDFAVHSSSSVTGVSRLLQEQVFPFQ